MDSDDYMNMINNPVINPPRSQNNQAGVAQTTTTAKKLPLPPAFAKVAKASVKLTNASQDLYLESETDAPFEWVNSDWTKSTPPETEEELIQCGFLDESEQSSSSSFSTESLKDFFETLPDTHQRIHEAFNTISSPESTKVYRIGDTSITVLVLAVVEDVDNPGVYSLVGLKSLLVMT